MTVMAGSGPQQASLPHAESVNVSQPNELPNLERKTTWIINEKAVRGRSMWGKVAIDERAI